MMLASGPSGLDVMRILIADQSRTMRNITRAVLAQLGHYDVDEAADAAEAVSRVRFAEFALCIFDRSMPDAEGVPFARALELAGFRAEFIALTRDDESLQRAEHPKVQILQKPFAPEALRRAIAQALPPQPVSLAA
ncbi:MAG: response regulator [Phycisphaeraceae bacterium]|nr:response regulator [Phycisphaeraceae bacterium]